MTGHQAINSYSGFSFA